MIEGDFVVFLIGMRIRKPWLVHKWFPVYRAMGTMLRALGPADGLLGFERAYIGGPAVVQYWRSQEQLDAFAHGALHKTAWRAFNRGVRATGAVGVWHETYQVRATESAYVNLPVFGLAAAAQSS
jgi:heme-degrading monooxygenase HmoA